MEIGGTPSQLYKLLWESQFPKHLWEESLWFITYLRAAWRAVEVSALALERDDPVWEATPPAGADPPSAKMPGFGLGALAAAGSSNLKMPPVYRVSGAELGVDSVRVGVTVGQMKKYLSEVYEMPVCLQTGLQWLYASFKARVVG